MKKGNLLLIIISVLILIIIGVFIKIKSMKPEPIPPISIGIDGQVEIVTDRNNYYMVQNCVKKFYNFYSSIFEDMYEKEENIEKTYNLLDEKYINFKGITKENIETKLPEVKESVVNIYNMYILAQDEKAAVYVAEGILRRELTNELSNFQIMIQIDLQNETFSVLPQDYIQSKYPNLDIGTNIKIEQVNNIEKNRNNSYVYEEISDSTYILDLVERYKEEAIYNPELAFDNLDNEYRVKRFGTLDSFKEYVNDNMNIEIEKYVITKADDYTQYMCMDTKGYYYIFRETGLMKYTLILDIHTLDLPEFLEKYNKANTVEKSAYNIQRCLDAINNKDYAYVYNKLDFEFKAVNYPTLENFELIIKTKLFNRNEVVEVQSKSEGTIYIYKLTIGDMENSNNKQKMTVIMQLKEGTDFVMSLSFE